MGILFALHNMGIRLAIDDFGTDYSPGLPQTAPSRRDQIDKSFIIQLTPSSDDAIIVRSTVDMASSLGLTVMAEGVETAATLQYLRHIGCQGGPGLLHQPTSTRRGPPQLDDRLAHQSPHSAASHNPRPQHPATPKAEQLPPRPPTSVPALV